MMGSKKETTLVNNIIKRRHILKRYGLVVLSVLLMAIVYNLFVLPNDLVYGGISGIAIITQGIIDPSTFILIANIILLIASYFILGIDKTKGSIIGAVLYPLFIQLTSNIGNIIVIENKDMLLSILFAGFISGVASGVVFKYGFSTGGTDIIAEMFSKIFKVSIGKSALWIDGTIIVLGAIYFGVINALYAALLLYIYSIMTDKIILGVSDNKAFYIITDKEEEVKDYVLSILNHGITILKAKGGYHGRQKDVLLCVVPARHYFKLREGISLIDSDAFFVVTDAYEVKGGA